MGKSRIEGITIEIDGNTKPLKAALESVNKTIRSTRDSLRDVDRLLKLDPGNADLLAQKQRLLSETIEETKGKLNQLKLAQQQAKAQLEKGELGKDRYDALQREIIATEKSLNDLTEQAKKTSAALTNSATGISSFASAAEKASNKVSGLSKAAGGLLGAAVATVPATTELNRDLSFLYNNAREAGTGINATEKAFKTFNAISGETDSSIEAVSNLLQAGFTTSNLQIAVEGLAGAATRFPDTLKIEGLADGLQETLATGKAIGPFGELLDRLGIGADNFSEKLGKCTTAAERQDLALQTLADAGLIKSYKGWAKSNKELVEYETTTIEAQMALKDFAKTISPVVTQVTNFATKAVEGYNKLSPAAQKAALAFTAITAATGPALSGIGKVSSGISALSGAYSKATAASKTTAAASKGLSVALKAIPYAAAIAGAAGLAVAIYKGVESIRAETNAASKAAAAREKSISSVMAQNRETELYFQKLKELEAVENKTATQKKLMQQYVDQLNESVEGLNLQYDAEKDKLNQSTDAIYKKIEAQKQEAIQAAYLKQSKKALEDYAEAQIKLADKQAELSQIKAKYNEIGQKEASITYEEAQRKAELGEEISELNREIEDLTTASEKYNQEAKKLTNQAALQSEQWKALEKEAKESGIKIPENLIQGMRDGSYAVPTTVGELSALIDFQTAVDNAGIKGQALVDELKTKIANGTISVTEATAQLTAANTRELSNGVQRAGVEGQKTGKNYSSGISMGAEAAKIAGQTIANAGNSGTASVSFYPSGVNAGRGYARGIMDTVWEAANAAAMIAESALAEVRKRQQEHSPAKAFMPSGSNAAKGYAIGMTDEIKFVEKAARSIPEAALSSIGNAYMTNGTSVRKSEIKSADYSAISAKPHPGISGEEIYSAMKRAASEVQFIIKLDQRELGRGLRGMGVQFQ